jgi:chemotaxis protein MotB
MSRKKTMLIALSTVILFLSCGTKKKLASANTEIEQLKAQNAQLSNNINDLKNQVSDLTAKNNSMTSEFNQYKASCQESEKKLAAIRDMLQDQVNTLEKIEKKIEEAEADFRSKGVEVYYKDGLVYVRMAESLLYKSGSAALGESGKKALGNLASVLNDYPKLKVIVLGNTDDVMFKKGSDNWTLSTERANGVIRTLRDDYQVDPLRLTSAGKGKYNPIADNTTEEGRAQNRRTDIILNPDLDRIWESVQQ